MRDIAAGDNAALGVVWDRYARQLRGVMLALVGPDQALEDMLQEVFIALYRGAPRIKDRSALRSYLIGVTTRVAALELRKRKARRWIGLTATGELPEQPTLPENAEERDAMRALHRVLDQLSSRRRLVFALRHVQELELWEIAGAVGISESTTRRDLAQAEHQVAALARREPALSRYLGQSRFSRGVK